MSDESKQAVAVEDPVRSDLKAIVEALIFASPEPVTIKALIKLLDAEPKEDIVRAIDALKQSVPIWKKEVARDGAYWVDEHA